MLKVTFALPAVFALTILAAPLQAAQYGNYVEQILPNEFSFANSDAEAARFLTQATFGVTRADISAVRAMGYEAWINQQIQVSPSLVREKLEDFAATLVADDELFPNDRVDTWFQNAVTGPDQLRQRMAFALSQIMVTSDQSDTLNDEVILLAEYQDILTRNAFGNYYNLLKQVSLSPMMGLYLTHLRNRKKELIDATTNTNIEPDENYAREIMQLFSIGLTERNQDFSQFSSNPTYDQNIITNLARVLTGFSYRCIGGTTTVKGVAMVRDCNSDLPGPADSCIGNACNFQTLNFLRTPARARIDIGHGIVHPDRYSQMICYPRYHDVGLVNNSALQNPTRPAAPYLNEPYRDKRVVGFDVPNTLPPLTAADRCDDLNNIANPSAGQIAERNSCVAYCDGELDQALTALFVHPNTAPMVARQLIQRFVTSNPTPGYISRVAAVFTNNGNGVRGDLAATIKAILLDFEARGVSLSNTSGKLREPLLKLTAALRSFGAVAPNNRSWAINTTLQSYGQRPLGAPTVFNFYEPDYRPPGALGDAGLFAPEMQILNEATAVTTANDLYIRLCAGYGSVNFTTRTSRNNCAINGFSFVTPRDRAYIPANELDALPGNFEALVEELNTRLMYGSMSGTFSPATGMKGTLKNRLEGPMSSYHPRLRALLLIHLILVSPEFAVQR